MGDDGREILRSAQDDIKWGMTVERSFAPLRMTLKKAQDDRKKKDDGKRMLRMTRKKRMTVKDA